MSELQDAIQDLINRFGFQEDEARAYYHLHEGKRRFKEMVLAGPADSRTARQMFFSTVFFPSSPLCSFRTSSPCETRSPAECGRAITLTRRHSNRAGSSTVRNLCSHNPVTDAPLYGACYYGGSVCGGQEEGRTVALR